MDMGIQAALCVPVRLAGEVDAVLYLDSRRGERTADAAGTGYCEAVARACGWALANLRRADLDRRQAAQEREMTLAREAQRVLLAPESGECGPIRFAGRVRPGLSVAGDLFDVMPLPGGRAAVCIGDVSGHGLGPGIVMAMTQANLHAHLALSGDPARALSEVNRFVCGRVEAGRFISLWLGVIGADGTVAYVDAGHGHVRIVRAPLSVEPNGRDRIEVPPARGDIPLGIDPDRRYTAEHLHLGPRDRLVLYSDGIVEQRDSFGQEFGIARLEAAVQASDGPGADVQAVFEALDRFTRGAAPTDDATAASIALNPGC
jgi:sigma-B regulation protein RsbU (phosphoserine phosphatase)